MTLPPVCNVQPVGVVDGPDGWFVWVSADGAPLGPVWVSGETS